MVSPRQPDTVTLVTSTTTTRSIPHGLSNNNPLSAIPPIARVPYPSRASHGPADFRVHLLFRFKNALAGRVSLKEPIRGDRQGAALLVGEKQAFI